MLLQIKSPSNYKLSFLKSLWYPRLFDHQFLLQ
uniref:Uncharacterized protein n=1 Tax=Arundo donax TaxID=35708 RepID=A0A0A8Z054_ARUDO